MSNVDHFCRVRAQTSNNFREQYLLQFEQIVENIKQNKLKVENRRHIEKAKRDEFNDTYLELIEKQRLYFKGVKDFKDVSLTYVIGLDCIHRLLSLDRNARLMSG